MSREDSGEILSDDNTDPSDCPGQSRTEPSEPDTNTTQLMVESEREPEDQEVLVVPQVVESQGLNWTAVDVYKIFHQFNRSTPGKESELTSQPNISAPQTDLNRTLLAIKQSNITANITGDNTGTGEKEETGERERRSVGSGYYHQPLHISREDDVPVLSVGGAEAGLQYHSILILAGVLPLAAVLLYLVTLLVKAMRDSKLQSRERYESGESGLSQIVISQTRYEAQDRGGWQVVIRDENSNQEAVTVPRKRSLEKKGDGRQQ